MSIDHLWAPWRMHYIQQLDEDEQAAGAPKRGCFLCEAAKADASAEAAAAKWLLLQGDARGMIILNRYPYTSGHLLVSCNAHVGDLTDLTAQQRSDLMELTVIAEQTIRLAYHPQGINIGINLGRCAGAGLPGHLHVHLVPRWNGDTNFMSVVGHVRVVPQALEESFEALREAHACVVREMGASGA